MTEGGSRNVVSGDAVVGGPLVQAQTIRDIHFHATAPSTGAERSESDAPSELDAWVRRVTDSCIWQHIPDGRDSSHHRRHSAAVVAGLARMRDDLERLSAGDPWCDSGIATRFLDNVEWLLGEPVQTQAQGQARELDLYPAEASLFVLFPFLHRVHYLRRVVELAEIRPWTLRTQAGAGPGRKSFELFTEGDDGLVQRALRDDEAESSVGWWLFHRWVAQHQEFTRSDSVSGLLADLGPSSEELGGALDAGRLTALLHGLRRGPDVCHQEFLDLLPSDYRVRSGPGHQQVRFQRVALIVALAFSMAIDMTALPDIVAEHLAIPHPVNLEELRRTLADAEWGGSHDLPVLRVECPHEAVLEGLREYTARADELLHTVRRTVRERITQPVPPLPTRLSAHDVTPADGAFDGYARFRSDGRRVLDLAMGIELYKDRDLAVRELYQNALDACRYRRARSEYLRRTGVTSSEYTGRISFVQGTDDSGRAYLECQDDGIGMGEAELRGVFSHAGARFAEQLEFKLERAQWETLDPPVTLYPNSRFGIGVLSYFMLADEIRVTTCRMGSDGVPGPVFEVSICGPGHLFRIVRTTARGSEPGTRVRLHLRADVDPDSWSSVEVLERLLAIAEFPTTARCGELTSVWEAGRLRARKDPGYSKGFRLNAHGHHVSWPPDSDNPQVVWCERGGALLVDGLLVEPTVRKGVFSSSGSGLTGAVVNLHGEASPVRLSVDRRNVVDDVASTVLELLTAATCVLTQGDAHLANFEWLSDVTGGSAVLGDLLTSAFSSNGSELTSQGMVFGDAQHGVFPADLSLVPTNRYGESRSYAGSLGRPYGYAPDHIYLWRILARRPRAVLRKLADLCPEIEDPRPLRRPTPSDQWLLQTSGSPSWRSHPLSLRDMAHAADTLQWTGREVAQRLADLGFPDNDPRYWSDDAQLSTANGEALQRRYGHSLTRTGPVTSADLMLAAERSRKGVTATVEFLRGFGLDVADDIAAMCEAAEKDDLLRLNPEARTGGCLAPDAVVPLGHIAHASVRLDVPVSEVCRMLAAHGLRTDAGRLPERPSEETLLLLSAGANGQPPWLDMTQAPPPGHVLSLVEQLGLGLSEVLAAFDALGFARHEPFPADAAPDDIWLLYDELYGGFLTRQAPLTYGNIFSQAEDLEGVRYKLGRLRAYGFDVPMEVPRRPTGLDREIFHEDGPGNWWLTDVGDVVPLSFVLLIAHEVGASPASVVRRLHACNIPTSHSSLPKGLSFSEALRLMRAHELDEGEVPEVGHFPLQYLIETALRKRTSITTIASLLQHLGIPVPDPTETIRRALAHIPRPAGR
ncbi:wHTH domain-containing protein [Streptomyces bluensis]|uniref:wHTH domain-containing protein n=1 Tax=Streptomyces bluensis TaxID=33897 RepID=UPI0019A0176F|nr:ATP-binding protein [Streptomyces bluensis]GGZ61807.1 hypothetical protein GCM10010344_30050 [Streptomyces bluensis]